MSPSRAALSVSSLLVFVFAASAYGQRPTKPALDLQWLTANDTRFSWLNVAAWEPKTDGLEPVRMPKEWRDKIPAPSANRALATAGVAVRFRTDAAHIALRVTFIDTPAGNPSPESA